MTEEEKIALWNEIFRDVLEFSKGVHTVDEAAIAAFRIRKFIEARINDDAERRIRVRAVKLALDYPIKRSSNNLKDDLVYKVGECYKVLKGTLED